MDDKVRCHYGAELTPPGELNGAATKAKPDKKHHFYL